MQGFIEFLASLAPTSLMPVAILLLAAGAAAVAWPMVAAKGDRNDVMRRLKADNGAVAAKPEPVQRKNAGIVREKAVKRAQEFYAKSDPENVALWKTFSEVSLAAFQQIYDRLVSAVDYNLGESFYNDKVGGFYQEVADAGITDFHRGRPEDHKDQVAERHERTHESCDRREISLNDESTKAHDYDHSGGNRQDLSEQGTQRDGVGHAHIVAWATGMTRRSAPQGAGA